MLRESSDGYSSVPQEESSCDMSYTSTRPYKNKSRKDLQIVIGVVIILAILFGTFVSIFYATYNKEKGVSPSSQLQGGELSQVDTFAHGLKKPEFTTADDHKKASDLEQDGMQETSAATTQKSTSPGNAATAKHNVPIIPTVPNFPLPFGFQEISSESPQEKDNGQASSPSPPAKDQVNGNTITSEADSVEVIEHFSDTPSVHMTDEEKEHASKDNETLLEDENTQNSSNETVESDQLFTLENLLNAIYGVPVSNSSKPSTDGTTKWVGAINQAPPMDVGIAIAAAVSTLVLLILTVVVIVCVVKRHRRRKQRQESIQNAIADLQVRDKVVLLNSEDSEE